MVDSLGIIEFRYQFAGRLLQARLAGNYSQGEVARKLGVTRQCWQNWEYGHSLPPVYLLRPIAAALRVDLAELLP
jgi:transcriptional regulator with XRE-family HTH domain